MIPQPPPGQDPIDPRPAFSPPPPPGGGAPPPPPVQFQQGHPGPGPMPPGGGPPPGAFPPPPGGYPPPPMMPPFPPPPMYMPPPPPRHSFARGIFLTMATTIFGLSLAANIYLLLFSGLLSGSSASSRQTVISEGDAKQKIAVIPVVGIIMGEQAEKFDRFITMAERDKDVKAVVLAIDSPGGSVTASDEIHHRITQFRARTADQNRKVPIVVSMGSLAASGGYYVACAADYVIAEPTTMTGNIGVLFPRYNVSKLAEKWGVEETTLESTGADFKNAGSMFKPENPQEVAYFQNIIDQAFAQFKTVVRNGRTGHTGFDPKKLDDIANGKIYTARDAEKLGLIDHVGYMADAIAHATTSAGLSSPQVVRYHNPPSFFDVLTSGRSTAPSPDASAKVNASAVTVKMDWQTLQELTTPRLLYLWRGE